MDFNSKTYAALRNAHFPTPLTLREPADFHEPIGISEKLIQAVWANQLFDQKKLKTQDGKPLKIINPGRWNTEGGPDFKGAQILISEKPMRGDVEIHLHATGWKEHQHHLNPAYNRVVLDVCLWGLSRPHLQTQNAKTVHQLVLHPHLQCSLDELVESLDPDRYPFSPVRNRIKPSPLLKIPKSEAIAYVRSAGLFRFEQKSLRIQASLESMGYEETAYQCLAEALGYKHNRFVFRQIASELPLSKLKKMPSDKKIQELLSLASQQPVRYHQVRPANHPHRRLAALALLTEKQPVFKTWFEELVVDSGKLKSPPTIAHPFWSWHYHLESNRLAKSLSLLGQTRWMEIVTNVILPFSHACGKVAGNDLLVQRVLEQYQKLPAAQINLASRQIAYDLDLKHPSKAIEQQGLIQMYQDFDLLFP